MNDINAKILGTGSYFPDKILTNVDLENMVETSDEWITTRTGIKERHIAADNQVTSDLGYLAAKNALDMAGLEPQDIDLIISCTITPDMPFPNTGALIANKLGLKKAPAFDIEAACSGFLYGLSIGNSFIKSGKYKNILVIASEILSRIINWKDRNTCVLFGDGSGAAVLSVSDDDSKIIDVDIYSNGAKGNLLYVPGGGTKNPATKRTVENNMHFIHMEGNEVFKLAVTNMVSSLKKVLKNNNVDQSDIKFLIPHQANKRIIDAVAKRVNVSYETVVINLDKYGNTSAATIITALDQIVRQGKVKKNDIIALTAFGGGLTWASGVLRW